MKTLDINCLSEMLTSAKGVIKCPVTHVLIDDYKSHELIDTPFILNEQIKCITALDHDTPSGSEAAALIQKKIIAYALENDFSLLNGEGIGTGVLMESNLVKGDVVIGIEEDLTTIGAIGALGISLDLDTLRTSCENGYVSVKAEKCIGVRFTGCFSESVSSKDLVLSLYDRLDKSMVNNSILIFKDDSNEILSLEDRMTICAHARSLGALTCIFTESELDETKLAFIEQVDLNYIKIRIAGDNSYDAIKTYSDVNKFTLSQAFIGGISGGKIEDLRAAARVLKGKKLIGRTRMIIAPATAKVFIEAMHEGLIHIFLDAGCVVMNQGYSADYGKSQGILTNNEVMISSGLRNEKGYIGPDDTKVFIASPTTVAKAAVQGYFGLE